MYARVGITTGLKKDALVVPVNAVVDLGGRRGVFVPQNESAVFRAIQVGTEQSEVVEVLAGIAEGDTVITTGAAALRDGDRVLFAGRTGGRGRRGGDAQAQSTDGSAPAQGGAPRGDGARQGAASDGRFGSGDAGARGDRSGGTGTGATGTDGRRFSGEGRRFGGDGSRYGGSSNGRRGNGERPPGPSSQ
jgi:hypothetical protein